MKRALLFFVPLVALCAVPAQAQQTSDSSAASDSAPPVENMTPRQAAELRADILMARKEFVDAIRAYDGILQTSPNDAAVLNKVGVAFQQLMDLGRAEHYYKKAMHADKNFASAVNNVGTVEYERKHYGKAIGYYKKALELHSDMAAVYSNLAYAYVEDKKFPEAMDAFKNALAIDPTVFDHKGGSGTVVQQRTATDPGLFYFFVAKSYALAGDAERAARYLKLSRDDGYKEFTTAQTDPAFSKVIKDPRVQEVLTVAPSYATDRHKTT
jgi:tetratricopeptide (TPR) repeat protein